MNARKEEISAFLEEAIKETKLSREHLIISRITTEESFRG